ncbi:hypothetical protein GIB67_035200 [Kingdonia uniflora]|uniref:Uncharacterized protein n=1 Tax=Kingdonia uniflora TaxID=39325 RepID=A0A7J7LDR8_9MAGN|nr:hypothetical protein GIB67_035200 [Kingdonia uniflora]
MRCWACQIGLVDPGQLLLTVGSAGVILITRFLADWVTDELDSASGLGLGFVKYQFVLYSARMHAGPVTCLALTEDQLILSGSSLGSITIACLSSDQQIASLKSTGSTGYLYLFALLQMMNNHMMIAILIS